MEEVFHIINEMSPYLLLGFLLAGMMHVFIPGAVYSRYLAGHSFRSVVYAALFGIPLPLCSCGVIPTAMSLRREGASKGAAVSFLTATPQTGVDSIIATYSLMGLPFAIVRPIAALTTALFGGHLVNVLDKEHDQAVEVAKADDSGCSCHDHHDDGEHLSFGGKIKAALRYAFLEMMEDIGKWLVVGLIVAGLITVFVPDSFFAVFKDNTMLSMLLVLCIAIPMYICATGSIPIAVALMMKGLTPGAALVLLMAGPACNVASILVINKVLGRKTLIIYVLSIVFGSIVFGIGIDQLLPREWFIPTTVVADACCEEGTSWFNIGCSILLFLLLANALWHHYRHGSSCSCGHDHGHHHGHEHEHSCCCGEHHEHEHSCCCGEHHDHEEHEHDCCCSHDEVLKFKVKGMNCSHCRSSVLGALQSLNGVEEATVDLASGMCSVTGHAKMEDVKQAVESLGFSVESR